MARVATTRTLRRDTIPSGFSGLVAWYVASSGCHVQNGLVDFWHDMSGNGNHLIQPTTAARPTFEETGFNSLPSVKFDGIAQFMTANNVAASETGNSVPVHTFCVFQQHTAQAGDAVAFTSSASDSPFYCPVSMSATNWRTLRRDDATVLVTVTEAASDTNRHTIDVAFAGATESTVRDGANRSGDPTAMVTTAMTVNRFSIGCRNLSSGAASFAAVRVPEVFIFSAAQSTANAGLLRKYLQTKYGTW